MPHVLESKPHQLFKQRVGAFLVVIPRGILRGNRDQALRQVEDRGFREPFSQPRRNLRGIFGLHVRVVPLLSNATQHRPGIGPLPSAGCRMRRTFYMLVCTLESTIKSNGTKRKGTFTEIRSHRFGVRGTNGRYRLGGRSDIRSLFSASLCPTTITRPWRTDQGRYPARCVWAISRQ